MLFELDIRTFAIINPSISRRCSEEGPRGQYLPISSILQIKRLLLLLLILLLNKLPADIGVRVGRSFGLGILALLNLLTCLLYQLIVDF